MPFNQLRHRPSFPPTQVHLTPSSNTSNQQSSHDEVDEFDENPISFFLTTPEDDFDFEFPSPEYDDLEDLSAGIEGSPEHKSLEAVREVSPSSIQRSRLPEVEEEEYDESEEDEIMFGVGIPLSLRDFTRLSSSPPSRYRHSQTQSPPSASNELQGLGISVPSNRPKSGRGRAQIRLTPNNPARGRTRSLSARRSQSWRVPSPDIWSIEEEREDDASATTTEEDGRNAKRERSEVYSSSAPVQSAMVKAGEKKDKVKKRVHWAI